jgi:hypothetical protein
MRVYYLDCHLLRKHYLQYFLSNVYRTLDKIFSVLRLEYFDLCLVSSLVPYFAYWKLDVHISICLSLLLLLVADVLQQDP